MSTTDDLLLQSTDGESARREVILKAATECFAQLGIQRTSVADVAKAAGVSRATVYRHFTARDDLIEGAIEYAARRFYADMAAAAEGKSTLTEQIGAMAEVHARIMLNQHTHPRLMADDGELLEHLFVDGNAAVMRTAEFIEPYVRAAKKRGEVGSGFSVGAASEWLARMLFSFAIVDGGRHFDLAKPASVRRFVKTFAVNGLR